MGLKPERMIFSTSLSICRTCSAFANAAHAKALF